MLKLRKVSTKDLPKTELKVPVETKSAVTERILQGIQTKFFELKEICKKECDTCKTRKCDPLFRDFMNTLTPYGSSIYKRNFKHRSTLEEMDRVLTESLNSLLLDIWDKGKVIHKSFGAMLRWKMVHYLDGKINLFDSPKFVSQDAIRENMSGDGENSSEGSNDCAEDLIEYYHLHLIDQFETLNTHKEILKIDIINTIVQLVSMSKTQFSKFMDPREKARIETKVVYGLLRFFQNKENFILFYNDPRARFYYTKALDSVIHYLDIYSKLN